MHHETGTLSTADGLTLLTRRWWPDQDPKGVILLVHGINEHSGRYAYMASHLMANELAVLAYDHRGHGKSEGERSYVEAFSQYVADLVLVHQWARGEAGERPIMLMGHSLGGLIAAAYVVDVNPPDLAGVVLSSPALQIPKDVSPFLQRISGVVSRIAPRFRANKVNRQHISRDPKVIEAYNNDPFIDQGGVRARTGHEILKATEHVRAHPDAFTMPLYLFHGTADKITDPDGSRWLYAEAPSSDKTLQLYDGFYHETMNEPERDMVLDDLRTWLLAHC